MTEPKGRTELNEAKTGLRLLFRSTMLLASFCLLILSFGVVSAQAQDDPPGLAPPPLKQISKSEKDQLAAETNIKDHTKLALELMALRLKKAEELSAGEVFDDMFTELGGFHAIMDNTLAFLIKGNTNNGKVLNNIKRFEIGLRAFMPRLETLRRESPTKYETYVRNLIKYLRDARSKAIEPFFGTSVVPDGGSY